MLLFKPLSLLRSQHHLNFIDTIALQSVESVLNMEYSSYVLLCWDTVWIMRVPTQIYPEHPSLRQGCSVTVPYDVSQIPVARVWHTYTYIFRADC